MAGYWPSSFLHVYEWTKTEPIKDLLYGFLGNFSWGTRRVDPSEQDSSILPSQVANHSAEFDSSCALMEVAI